MLFQHKQITKSHTLQVSKLEDLRKNAIDADKLPVYVVSYDNYEWVMVPSWYFKDVLRETT